MGCLDRVPAGSGSSVGGNAPALRSRLGGKRISAFSGNPRLLVLSGVGELERKSKPAHANPAYAAPGFLACPGLSVPGFRPLASLVCFFVPTDVEAYNSVFRSKPDEVD